MAYRTLFAVALLAIPLAFASRASAQVTPVIASANVAPADMPTVSANGSAALQRQPKEMVMHVELLARGKSLKEAIANLKTRRETALAQLKTLAADMDSVKFDNPTTSSALGQAQQQMQQMILQRVRASGGPVPAGLKTPESTTVTMGLTARWKLNGEDISELLEQIDALKKRIEAADLAGAKDKEELSAAEQELLEEAGSFNIDPYSGEEATPPGTPQFAFVATITDAERQEALQQAYKKAERSATELAAAAGMKITGLATLASQAAGNQPYEDPYGYMAMRRNAQLTQRLGNNLDTENSSLSTDFAPVNFDFSVTATFRVTRSAP